MPPEFSIITVCFNSEKTIQRTLQSVLDQTYENYEYIIVDGASTDRTIDIVRSFMPLFNGKMRVISEPDQGIYDAMNKGIRNAKGTLIGMVNSDDYYEPDALENIHNAYTGYEYSIIYGLLRKVKDCQEVSVYMNNASFLESTMITHPTCFVSKAVYDDFGLYSMKYKYSADYEFMLRMHGQKEVQFFECYKIISNFSVDGASGSVKGYRDTLRLKHEYKLLGGFRYYWPMLKSWIVLKLGR